MSLLATRMVAKPWGRETLPAPFVAPPGEKIGEVWFEPPAELDRLLVKYLFTSEKLSIQDHPGGPNGKEECWLVIAAEPGATLGVGFREPIGAEAMRAAALDGSIEGLLMWHPVETGTFFYIPAGTVHAIGAGVSLIEVQQNNDVTYRLYDYGRPRELHLDAGIAVALGQPHDPALHRMVPPHGSFTLVEGPLFRLDQLDGAPDAAIAARYRGPLLVIPRDGEARVAGGVVKPGQCAAAASLDAIELRGVALIAQPC
ncbi:MAG TPA: class I mannose-6-phosphate isomerase [Novosphingobium sp.]|nr:class I mannose-6-phosphate isomerase [Novosphingobium sp.]